MSDGGLANRIKDMGDDAQDLARDTNDHPIVEWAARIGYAASGLVHLLIGWAALGVVWAPLQHGTADQSGAFGSLAQTPWGGVLLWVLTFGFAGLGLWQLTEGIGGWFAPGREGIFKRVKAVAKSLAYFALGWAAFGFARGAGTDSRSQSSGFARDLLTGGGGRLLVVLVGAGIIGVGGYHIVKGWKRTFLEDLVENPGRLACEAGRLGYIAKGLALIVAGVLFAAAALQGDAGRATGLDGALRALVQAPFGMILLTFVGLGIAACGVYSFFRARHTRL